MICSKSNCPMSAVGYPRIIFQSWIDGALCGFRMLFDYPVCDEHRTPFAESIINQVSKSPLSNLGAEIESHFVQRYGRKPNELITGVDYLSLEHADVIEWLKEVDARKKNQPAHLRNKPIVIEHVSWDEFDYLMGLYPDVAMPWD